MNKAEIKIVEEQINNCWQVASEIIEEFLEIIICHGSLRSEFLGKLCRL